MIKEIVIIKTVLSLANYLILYILYHSTIILYQKQKYIKFKILR